MKKLERINKLKEEKNLATMKKGEGQPIPPPRPLRPMGTQSSVGGGYGISKKLLQDSKDETTLSAGNKAFPIMRQGIKGPGSSFGGPSLAGQSPIKPKKKPVVRPSEIGDDELSALSK